MAQELACPNSPGEPGALALVRVAMLMKVPSSVLPSYLALIVPD
jgi:hypothetical protein